jgi:anti-sigma factor RsiW
MKVAMTDPVYQTLLETSWRRELTPDEQARLQAWLSAHPEARDAWLADRALNRALRQLPDAPLASNFTAQVLRAAAAEQARRGTRSQAGAWWEDWGRLFLPRVAWASMLVLLSVGAVHQVRYLNRSRIAHHLAMIPVGPELPPPEVLQDFDAIKLSSLAANPPGAAQGVSDEALFKALE